MINLFVKFEKIVFYKKLFEHGLTQQGGFLYDKEKYIQVK